MILIIIKIEVNATSQGRITKSEQIFLEKIKANQTHRPHGTQNRNCSSPGLLTRHWFKFWKSRLHYARCIQISQLSAGGLSYNNYLPADNCRLY